MVEQKVVRTYRKGYTKTTETLQKYLNEGYIVIFVTPFIQNGDTEYVEYIIQKSIIK